MKKLVLYVGFYGILAVILMQWIGMTSQEVIAQMANTLPNCCTTDWKVSVQQRMGWFAREVAEMTGQKAREKSHPWLFY